MSSTGKGRRPQSLGSDNHAGAHPEVMQALVSANEGHAGAYGVDATTEHARALFRRHFGDTARAEFVLTGTAANVLALRCMLPTYRSVVCASTAHIHVDECGAPERNVGCKVQAVPGYHGKLTPDAIAPCLIRPGDQHFAAPKVVSITQSTELGTVYTPDEIGALTHFCRQHGLLVHLDGARLPQAACALDVPLRALTTDVGVDVVSFGGNKSGLLFGEAVVFLRPGLADDFAFVRKQHMQLCAKMRFVSAQFVALLEGDLYLRQARHAQAMAQRLTGRLRCMPGVTIVHPVQANALFVTMPRAWLKPLREVSFFYVWHEAPFTVRLMTSFDTDPGEVDRFCDAMQTLASACQSDGGEYGRAS